MVDVKRTTDSSSSSSMGDRCSRAEGRRRSRSRSRNSSGIAARSRAEEIHRGIRGHVAAQDGPDDFLRGGEQFGASHGARSLLCVVLR